MLVIGMPLKNGEKTIKRAVISFLRQTNTCQKNKLLIVNDNSTDQWFDQISEYTKAGQIIIENVNLGKCHLVRNYIHEYARLYFPDHYIGRLDCDDEIIGKNTISKIQSEILKHRADLHIFGNLLRVDSRVIAKRQYASKKLLSPTFLSYCLKEMSLNNLDCELPSSNMFINTRACFDYPAKDSAEDHWLLVNLLLLRSTLRIHIDENLLYVIYSLNGRLSKQNMQNGSYLKSRIELYQHFELQRIE